LNNDLKKISNKIRLNVLEIVASKKIGHLGGTFSCIDLLVTLYYGHYLNYSDKNFPDKFILSKGHACLALYVILEDLGYISKKVLNSYGENGGLGGQVDIGIHGIDWNTGSLGHALGVCGGIAHSAKLKDKDYKAVTILGDAECDEGSIWEAIFYISDNKLNNVIAIVDRNRLSVTEIINDNSVFKLLPIALNELGWFYKEIDGHSFVEIKKALDESSNALKPTFIIANTIKGKGVSFMENELKWHHSVPTKKQLDIAYKELK
tara:strand:- start:801 stop:1589 length:789 start_codon:yes stop_codon:yes gene_type:complete